MPIPGVIEMPADWFGARSRGREVFVPMDLIAQATRQIGEDASQASSLGFLAVYGEEVLAAAVAAGQGTQVVGRVPLGSDSFAAMLAAQQEAQILLWSEYRLATDYGEMEICLGDIVKRCGQIMPKEQLQRFLDTWLSDVRDTGMKTAFGYPVFSGRMLATAEASAEEALAAIEAIVGPLGDKGADIVARTMDGKAQLQAIADKLMGGGHPGEAANEWLEMCETAAGMPDIDVISAMALQALQQQIPGLPDLQAFAETHGHHMMAVQIALCLGYCVALTGVAPWARLSNEAPVLRQAIRAVYVESQRDGRSKSQLSPPQREILLRSWTTFGVPDALRTSTEATLDELAAEMDRYWGVPDSGCSRTFDTRELLKTLFLQGVSLARAGISVLDLGPEQARRLSVANLRRPCPLPDLHRASSDGIQVFVSAVPDRVPHTEELLAAWLALGSVPLPIDMEDSLYSLLFSIGCEPEGISNTVARLLDEGYARCLWRVISDAALNTGYRALLSARNLRMAKCLNVSVDGGRNVYAYYLVWEAVFPQVGSVWGNMWVVRENGREWPAGSFDVFTDETQALAVKPEDLMTQCAGAGVPVAVAEGSLPCSRFRKMVERVARAGSSGGPFRGAPGIPLH
jgi:hypothetical protein